ncbi:MAG TPA: aspartate aminotransferase family protein [Vineibacter sp.]|nr:aspartate aminotransferase family protein [Vineibacter sp.]
MITAVMPTYARKDVAFERGEGSYLTATDGRRFLDFTSGIAVNNLGHCHPQVVKALQEQAGKLWHTSNLYRIAHGERLAQRLVETSFADTMFFGNSGAEAIEGGIKLVRKYQYVNGRPKRYKIICFEQAFHGRTGAALAATGNEKYLEGFGPRAPGFVHVPLNNTNVVRDAIDDETAAILVEPVQGEGGVRAGTGEFLRSLRQICDEFGLLLFYDEIQCGFGRTGKLWAHEWFDVKPDVMAIAKGIGNGFPLGAFLATEKAAAGMVPGTHGSTYGGNPLGAAVANAVLDVMLAPGFLEGVRARADWFRPKLEALVAKHPKILADVRGTGFITGLRCVVPSAEMVDALFERQMLTVGAGDNVVRIYPSLVAPQADLEHGLSIIDDACRALTAKLAAPATAGAAHG